MRGEGGNAPFTRVKGAFPPSPPSQDWPLGLSRSHSRKSQSDLSNQHLHYNWLTMFGNSDTVVVYTENHKNIII